MYVIMDWVGGGVGKSVDEQGRVSQPLSERFKVAGNI